MKGVSSVIAIILILMIVIALAALSYTWFSGIFSQLTSTAGTAVTQTTGAMATQFRIESARYTGSNLWNINVTIRNLGSTSFNINKTSVYVGGSYSEYRGICTATSCSPGTWITSIAPGATVVIYNISNATAACPAAGPAIIQLTIESGLQDSRSLVCA